MLVKGATGVEYLPIVYGLHLLVHGVIYEYCVTGQCKMWLFRPQEAATSASCQM